MDTLYDCDVCFTLLFSNGIAKFTPSSASVEKEDQLEIISLKHCKQQLLCGYQIQNETFYTLGRNFHRKNITNY